MASVAAQPVPVEESDYLANVLQQFGCRFTGIHIVERSRNERRLIVFNHGDQCLALLKRHSRFMPWRLHHATAPFGKMTATEFNDLLGS